VGFPDAAGKGDRVSRRLEEIGLRAQNAGKFGQKQTLGSLKDTESGEYFPLSFFLLGWT